MTQQETRQQTQTQTKTEATDFERLLKKEGKPMEYVPYGSQDPIKLTVKIIIDLIAEPTKAGHKCSERDAMKFMMMCQAKRLNPFEGDAFLVGYDSQYGPKFSLITAHQAFLKRAEMHPEYDGMESGIIVQEDGGAPMEIEGDFYLQGQTVVGGWARVHFKNRKVPAYKRLRLERFNSGFAQWKVDAAGMICKCAESDALRSSFPTMCGGLYLREEFDFMPEGGTKTQAQDLKPSDLVKVIESPAVAHAPSDNDGDLGPQEPKNTPSAQSELAAYVEAIPATFADFTKWAEGAGHLADPTSYPDWASLPTDVCKRMLRAKQGLKMGLEKMKGVGV